MQPGIDTTNYTTPQNEQKQKYVISSRATAEARILISLVFETDDPNHMERNNTTPFGGSSSFTDPKTRS
jgi:glycine betaine/choline ABC-type transport system substrate-binding protein